MTEKNDKIIVPAYRNCQELTLNMSKWEEAMSRLAEAKNLVPANYSSLEFTFQEAWRESKINAISVADAIKKAKQNVEEIKADIVLTEIPELLKEMPKMNNSDFRKAVMFKNQNYKKASEHLEKLEAMFCHFESHMKTMENTSRFLKKQMDYFIRNSII